MKLQRGLTFLKRHLLKNPRFLLWYALHFFLPGYTFKVKFCGPEELVEALQAGKSLIRMGDGEVHLMNGGSLPFQRFDPELASVLFTVIAKYTDDSPYVLGVNEVPLVRRNSELRTRNLLHTWLPSKVYWDLYYNHDATYVDASVFYYNHVVPEHFEEYLLSKHLVVVTNKQNLERFQKNTKIPFKNVSFVETPALHAYDAYGSILEAVEKEVATYGKDKTVVLAAFGPASKVLAYDLLGKVVVIDIGNGLEIVYNESKIDYIANPFLEHAPTGH